MENFFCEGSVSIGSKFCLNHVCFDGCSYFSTVKCDYKIIKFDELFKVQKCFDTVREYDCIVYDYYERCFWATTKECFNIIFKLNCNMEEIDCISFSQIGFNGYITSLSFNCCKNCIVVSFPNKVIEVKKDGCTKIIINNKSFIVTNLSLCPVLILVEFENDEYYLKIYNNEYNLIKSYLLPKNNIVKDIIFNPCNNCGDCSSFDFITCKNNFYYFLHKQPFDCFGFNVCECNYDICENCCDENCENYDACCEILKSVAQVENSVARILNAESKKLEKVINTSDDINEILCVNEKVSKTIINATHLEQVLYAKLDAVKGLCFDYKKCKSSKNNNPKH